MELSRPGSSRATAGAPARRDRSLLTVWTVGHSTRPAAEFVHLLRAYGIEAVADVRRYPGSRAHPHYAAAALAFLLDSASVIYHPLPTLGGRRRPVPESPNTAWRSAAFRGYADYVATDEFAGGLDDLVNLCAGFRTAVMCAEAVWWRCHRALIADVLCSLGIRVVHILGETNSALHPYTTPARIVDGQLTYLPN